MSTHIHAHNPGEHETHADDLVVDDDRYVEAVAHKSPEGRPTHRPLSSRGIKTLLIGIMVCVIVTGMLIAAFAHVIIGVVIAIAGALLLLANPVVWAAAHRAEERRKIEQDDDPVTPVRMPPQSSTRGAE